MLYFFCDEIVF